MRTPYIKKIVELHKIHKAIEGENGGNGGEDVVPAEITIDMVVKFIHDDAANAGYPEMFPYETWNEIPDITESGTGVGKSTTSSPLFGNKILEIPGYVIGFPKSM